MPADKPSKTTPSRPGDLIASYRCRPLRWGELLGLILIIGMAISAPLLYGYYRAQYASAYYGPVAARMWSRPWYLLTGLALIVSLALIVYRLFERRRHIDVHANGLLLALSGKKFIPWTSLSGVASGAVQARFLGIPLATRYQAILYPAVGKPVRLDGTLDNLPELLTQVKARLYPRMLAACLKAFSQGQRLYFGNISINQAELRVTDGTPSLRNLPWGNIHRIRVESGLLVIESENDKAIQMPVAEIPNLELLLQIIHTGVNR